MWRKLAEECGADRTVVEVVCADREEHRRRVKARAPPTPPLPAPSWEEVVGREYARWEEPVLTVDGREPPERNVDRILGAGPPDLAPRPADK
jgi:hypothetical protein